jgi:hypothetical protein
MTPQSEALTFLEEMTRRGVELRTEGERILFRPAALLTAEDRDRLRALKSQLLNLLEPGGLDLVLLALCASLPAEDAQDLREERAAILECEAGFTCADAERMAGIRSP